ncbi:hypothetical protein DQQ10_14240 [Pseudochryseolinea flava]|uniref:DUF4421 domain-containing protein n=2 Tax=Pseudochryseolinea flava TaxID=2059302 RepID=A0A364Y4K1_9BACT|nr:hypothetical protein DQQ10_14240 [Pseudochryseolinea flava]
MAAFLVCSTSLFAQGERKDKTAVTYEEIYDEPYSVNKLFVGIQPLYGELFVANVNAGFGAEAAYYLRDKADFRVHFRKTYSERFFDFSRDLASHQASNDNDINVFNYFEFGGTYHVKDFEESSKTKMFLYKKSYKGDKWAARVPLSADVPCKVRKIYGIRLGAIIWDSSTDLNRALDAQDLTFADLKPEDGGEIIPDQEMGLKGKMQDVRLFTNINAAGLYVGGSMAWIKNVAVNFDKFEEGIDDLIFTAYADILYSPMITMDDIFYTTKNSTTGAKTEASHRYDIGAVKTKSFGFRLGIDGRFNRQLSWAYGAEVGYRPAIEGRTFYALLKIAFPVFGTNLDYKVESFGK